MWPAEAPVARVFNSTRQPGGSGAPPKLHKYESKAASAGSNTTGTFGGGDGEKCGDSTTRGGGEAGGGSRGCMTKRQMR